MLKFLIVLFLLLIISQFAFLKICPSFICKKKLFYVIPIILCFTIGVVSPRQDFFSLIEIYSYLILMDLTISDFAFREVDAKSYFFLIPLIFTSLFYTYSPLKNVISFLLTFVMLFLFDKFRLMENIGGADLKLMFILALCYPIDLTFIFLIFTCLITVLMGLASMLKNKKKDVCTPMIFAITISHIITSFFYLIVENGLLRI